jgi:hypothetical protein
MRPGYVAGRVQIVQFCVREPWCGCCARLWIQLVPTGIDTGWTMMAGPWPRRAGAGRAPGSPRHNVVVNRFPPFG